MNADTGRAWSSERGSPCGLVEGRGRRSRHREMKCPARRWGEAQVADQPWLRRTKERGSSCDLALRAEHRVSHLCDARDATGSERRKGPFLSVRCRGSVAAPWRWSHPCRAVFVKERGTERQEPFRAAGTARVTLRTAATRGALELGATARCHVVVSRADQDALTSRA